jgi:putative ABC transport system permease protein
MLGLALRSLVHERGKFVAALCGVAFSATLVVCQMGLYEGFLEASSALVTRTGGDLWVMARGTQAVDSAMPLSDVTRALVAEHPAVASVRALAYAIVPVRKKREGEEAAFLVGFEPRAGRVMPWSLAAGLPQDLHAAMRVSVEESDLERLQITGSPLGQKLRLAGEMVEVAAMTSGIRSFTLAAFMFSEIHNVRRIAHMIPGQAQFWVVDLKDKRRAAEVREWVMRQRTLEVRTTDEFRALTEAYWVGGSGAGTALSFGALLGLLVGCVIVAQTLYAMTKDHQREFATLKAMGASRREILSVVALQAGLLALAGGAVAGLLSLVSSVLCERTGLHIVLSAQVLSSGALITLMMCALASIGSVRSVLRLDPAPEFR